MVSHLHVSLDASSKDIEALKNLDLQNNKIKSLRGDIRKSIYIIKSKRDAKLLPDLTFYKYKVKKYDSFWKILSRTSQNIDTLVSINSLSSPKDVYASKIIYIPNMRGILYEYNDRESIEIISKKYQVDKEYIYCVNKIDKCNKRFLFIPSASLSNLERSLFLGVGFALPVKIGRRTSKFGKRIDPLHKRIQFHNGIDIACPIGSKVYAARSGRVLFTGYKGGYGLLVIIKHSHDYYSYYGHLSKFFIKRGKYVKRGDVIALSGNTGRTIGPHLHFEVRKKTKPRDPGILLR